MRRGEVTIQNVPELPMAGGAVDVQVDGFGTVRGRYRMGWQLVFPDGGLPVSLELANLEALTGYAWAIRQALERKAFTGANGA